MKKVGLNFLILCLYCFPFGYFSIYTDFTKDSMMGYLIMIIITSTIAFVGKYSNNVLALIIGNILSVIVSYYFLGKIITDDLQMYIKVTTPHTFLIWISLLNLIPQLFAIRFADQYKIYRLI